MRFIIIGLSLTGESQARDLSNIFGVSGIILRIMNMSSQGTYLLYINLYF